PFTESRESYDLTTRRPPATLRRVGPHHRKNWFLYEVYLEREFLGWWEKTEYSHKLNRDGAHGSFAKPILLCLIIYSTKSNSYRKGKKRGSHQSLIPNSLQNHSIREPPNIYKLRFNKSRNYKIYLKTLRYYSRWIVRLVYSSKYLWRYLAISLARCSNALELHFKITNIKWRQVDYLVYLTKLFFQFTMALMKTKDVIIYSVFLIYRKLLEYIERSNQKLKKKTTP
ncbi:hypothetical protein N7504_006259, partial [Penicillium tannophilum]